MKKHVVILSALALAFFLSCSVEENTPAKPEAALVKQGELDNIMEGWKGIELKLDFSKLFEYSTLEEAQEKTQEILPFIISDMQEELSQRPDCTHASVDFFIASGRGTLHSVRFSDARTKVIRGNIVITSNGTRPYTHLTANSPEVYMQLEELLDKHYTKLDEKEIGSFIAQHLGKDKGVAQFEMRVDREGHIEIYGYTGN